MGICGAALSNGARLTANSLMSTGNQKSAGEAEVYALLLPGRFI